MIRISTFILILLATILISLNVNATTEEKKPVRSADEILAEAGNNITPAVIEELWDNCVLDDAEHRPVHDASRAALIKLGVKVLPYLCEKYIPSEALYHRLELDAIIPAIGHPATPYLIPFLKNESWYARQHAANLIGIVAAASSLKDPYKLGPLPEDLDALVALEDAVKIEKDWQVLRSIIGAIGSMRDPASISLIANYLKNDEQSVRISAVIGLGKIPSPDAMMQIVYSLLEDQMGTVHQTAILQLSTPVNGEIAFKILSETALSSDINRETHLACLESIARYLETVSSDYSPKVHEHRQSAFYMASTILDNTQTDWNMRGHAVKVLGYTHEPGAVIYLKRLEKIEKHPFVAGEIDLALKKLTEKKSS